MSIEEHKQNITDLKEGMALAEYNMLREKAIRGEMLVMSDAGGNIIEVPAREQFRKMYGEDLDVPAAPDNLTIGVPAEASAPTAIPGTNYIIPDGSVAPSEPIPVVFPQDHRDA